MARNQSENWRWRAYQDSQVDPEDDDRMKAARREAARKVCTAANRCPRGQGAAWRHPDAEELKWKGNRQAFVLSCKHCGHEWRVSR